MERHLLLIDDHDLFRSAVRSVLERRGITVREAVDGFTGLHLAEKNPPDVIICDLRMPLMDGLEVLDRVKASARLREIPFIVLSGQEDGRGRERCLEAGAFAYVQKWSETRDLLRVVDEALALAQPGRPVARAQHLPHAERSHA